MSSTRCYTTKSDCAFVISIIDSIQKLLIYTNAGTYGDIYASIVFIDKIKQKEVIKLTLEGYIVYVYKTAFKEPYPLNPTLEQIGKINAIWEALGHPEKKIPT